MAEAPSLYTHVPAEQKPFMLYRVTECRDLVFKKQKNGDALGNEKAQRGSFRPG